MRLDLFRIRRGAVAALGALVALLFKSRGRPGRVALEPPPAASTVPATPEPAPMIAEPANSVAEAVPEAPAAAARTPGPEEPIRGSDYFSEQVKKLLLDDPRIGGSPKERYTAVFKGGLSIHTTLDRAEET